MISPRTKPLGKLPTSIPGLDSILSGGIPELSINIISGPPGSGKTIFTQQILYTNATTEHKALYLVTLSEPSVKLLHYLQKFDFFDPSKVGTAVIYLDIGEIIREQGLKEAVAAIINYVKEYRPALIGIDSFKAIHDLATDPVEVRKFGYDLSVRLTTWGVTAFLVGEYTDEEIKHQPIFAIADGIIRLQNQPLGLHFQRYLDVLKLRGENYFTGLHPFEISQTGIEVYPRIKMLKNLWMKTQVSQEKLSTGIPELDRMLDGGLQHSTATMVAGGAGTGKTLMGLHFIVAGILKGEPGVIVTFQENPQQLKAIAMSLGWDLEAMEKQGMLVHMYDSPVELQPDIHAAKVKAVVDRVKARRIMLDSLKDIEIATPNKVRYKDYIYSLVNQLKLQGVTTIVTNEIGELFGPFQLSEYGVSFVVDNVILLRYVELSGRIGRAINIMKVRGAPHSKEIRFFEITSDGISINEVIEAQTGVLTGMPVFNNNYFNNNGFKELLNQSRNIMEILQGVEEMDINELANRTGFSPQELLHELENLKQQGMVITWESQNTTYYKSTI
ncbi:recombinase RecA [Moorena producens PAL-8-15-08-1]|uniref:non-specific serine/threonine protein kinase n=2 Tax=Moorena TaxID=1155738 RepID=A0A1D8TPK3_9CYAN|nr:ATPase domain-containing protein [Moorena producens]AOW99315.1 recombinase RecA [Moorena producens PAL-8-15-08-1]